MNGQEPQTGSPRDLFTSVYEGDEDAVVRLLRLGVSPEAVDGDGQSALYVAAVSDAPGIVRLLLFAGAAPDRLSAGSDLPLCGAACGGHAEVVRALLASGAVPDAVEAFGFTALAWALRCGHPAVTEALLAAGADPNRPGPTGEPPLVTAARRGSPACVRSLLAHGAGSRGDALTEARRWTRLDVASELRAGLGRAHGFGGEYVTRRWAERVTVELVRDGKVVAGVDQGNGHAEIVAVLEGGPFSPSGV